MSSDVVVFRTERIVPHVGVPGGRVHQRAFVRATEPNTGPTGAIEEIDFRPGLSDRLAERLSAGRARWSQLTFYLFDPASWR